MEKMETIVIAIIGPDQIDENKMYGTIMLTNEDDSSVFIPIWLTKDDTSLLQASDFFKHPSKVAGMRGLGILVSETYECNL